MLSGCPSYFKELTIIKEASLEEFGPRRIKNNTLEYPSPAAPPRPPVWTKNILHEDPSPILFQMPASCPKKQGHRCYFAFQKLLLLNNKSREVHSTIRCHRKMDSFLASSKPYLDLKG